MVPGPSFAFCDVFFMHPVYLVMHYCFQVYYYCIGAEYPMKYKTPEARRLYRAMRHPGTSCLTFILWCYPIMTLDRFLLAVMMTLYVSFGFNVAVEDYEYIALQSARKDYELHRYRTEFQYREVRG
jgi:hypothetical protein